MTEEILDAVVEEPGPVEAPFPLPIDLPEATANQEPAAASWQEMYDNPWLMLSMLFFVTAALGIPFLWRSRAFSVPMKLLLTVVVLAYTVLLFWLTWQVMVWSYNRLLEA